MISRLLWRCPLCGQDDALRHHRRWFRPDELYCSACGTGWVVRRVVNEDFRLRVVNGEDGWRGREMPLAQWYDLMKRNFRLQPRSDAPFSLLDGEEFYISMENTKLITHKDNPLFADWSQREPPRSLARGQGLSVDWDTLGPGRLSLTHRRLVWQDADRELDFWWEHVRTAFAWFTIVFGVMYGSVLYRFWLPEPAVLKWLCYADHVGRRLEAQTGRRFPITPY